MSRTPSREKIITGGVSWFCGYLAANFKLFHRGKQKVSITVRTYLFDFLVFFALGGLKLRDDTLWNGLARATVFRCPRDLPAVR